LFFVLSVFFIGLIVFRYPYQILATDSPFTYLVFPVLIWGALRFYQRGATSGMFIFSLIAVVCTSYGLGPFVSDSLGQSLFYLQSFAGTVAVTMLIFGAVVTERSMLARRKDEFISMASHELKTPLTAIKGFNQMLLRHSAPPDKLHLYLTKMDGSINRLAKLVDELLDVSRIQTGKLSLKRDECDVYDLVNDAIEEMQLVGSNRTIIFSDYVHKIIVVDKYRIHQVLFNLLTNAMKFSATEKDIVVSIREKNGFVVVSVKDLGVGISKSNLAKIFEPFYQERSHIVNRTVGLGLGLYISKQIINRHNGRIWIESEEGVGSTFLFSLPI
jgi:signal transduction histidine kinase